MEVPSLDLVATSRSPDGSRPARTGTHISEMPRPDSYFTSVQWSDDGTTLFTTSSENRLNTYVLPADLLSPRDEPLNLDPQGTLVLPEPLGPIAPCPYYQLYEPSTQLILTSSREHPIHLYHPFQPPPTDTAGASPESNLPDSQGPHSQPHQRPLASYFQINPLTESFSPITALIWPTPEYFYTGSTSSQISIFDITRPGSSETNTPTSYLSTVQKTSRRARVGLRGTISALSLQPPDSSYGLGGNGLLAAGTLARGIGLYDLNRAGSAISSWSIAHTSVSGPGPGADKGNGVMQILWSPCGQYMLVNERCSSNIIVYDVRQTHTLLARLTGRRVGENNSNQRLTADVYPGTSSSGGGFEVWGGTGDGGLVVWEDVGLSAGDIPPSWEKRGIHGSVGSAVSGAAMHQGGSVLATCSGSWKFVDYESDESDSDSSSESSQSDETDDTAETETESESESETSVDWSRITRPKPSNRIVVEETSLKIWSIRSGGAHNTGEGESVEEGRRDKNPVHGEEDGRRGDDDDYDVGTSVCHPLAHDKPSTPMTDQCSDDT